MKSLDWKTGQEILIDCTETIYLYALFPASLLFFTNKENKKERR